MSKALEVEEVLDLAFNNLSAEFVSSYPKICLAIIVSAYSDLEPGEVVNFVMHPGLSFKCPSPEEYFIHMIAALPDNRSLDENISEFELVYWPQIRNQLDSPNVCSHRRSRN